MIDPPLIYLVALVNVVLPLLKVLFRILTILSSLSIIMGF